jgi:hypothetical protein
VTAVAAGLLVLFTAASLLPEALAVTFGHSVRAWEYVLDGTLMAAAILILGALMAPRCVTTTERRVTFVTLAYGLFEAAQRPACRLVFPMDRAPVLAPGQYLCDAAGLRTAQLSVLFAAVVGFAVALWER